MPLCCPLCEVCPHMRESIQGGSTVIASNFLNVMLIKHIDYSVRLSLFPYFFEQPYSIIENFFTSWIAW